MMNTKPFVFNPDEEPREMLIATFVIRQTIFQKVFKGIKEASPTTPPQHFLLVGQRGMGKTTLLLRIKYAVEDDSELNRFMLIIRFPEEQYNIANLPDLWEETARYLENMDSAFEGILDKLEAHEKKDDYERVAFDLISSKLKQQNKRILFLIDNVGDLLKKFTDQENHRLREILMTSPHLQLIGASSEMLEYNFQYDKPFFEFFYLLKLQPLDKKEAVDLMKTLAANYGVTDKIEAILKNTPERVEILRRITGGVPRTLVLLFQIFVDYNDGSAFEDLEHLVDKVLPLYKARMDSLKPQQQKIIDALARAWEAISSADILEQSKLYREGITSNQISSQLKQLEDNQLVEVVDVGKRKKLYRIRERFFNIWYLMRNGRKQNKEQVLWLIRFLESWCTVEELREIAFKQIESLSNEKYSENAAYFKAIALHYIDCIDTETKQELLRQTEGYLLKKGKHSWADNIHKLMHEESNSGWLKQSYNAYHKGEIVEAEKILYQAIADGEKGSELKLASFLEKIIKNYTKAEEYYLKAIEKGDSSALLALANLYYSEIKDYDKAEEYYLKATEIKGNSSSLTMLGLIYHFYKDDYKKAELYYLEAINKGNTKVISNLASLYNWKLKDYDKAETYFLKNIESGDSSAFNSLGSFYLFERKDYNKAEKYLLEAVARGSEKAIQNLGHIYYWERKDYNKAEEYFLRALKTGRNDALVDLGILYTTTKEFDKAEEFFSKAVRKEQKNALYYLANFYYKIKDYNKAEKYYLKAIDNGEVKALFYLANFYFEKKDYNKAEVYYHKAAQQGNSHALNTLGILYEEVKEDYKKAENYFLLAVEKGDKDALLNLGVLYRKKRDFHTAIKFFLQALSDNDYRAVNHLISLYWKNNQHLEGINLSGVIFQKEEFFTKYLLLASELVVSLLVKEQYHFLFQEFKKENNLLMKYLQPMYYALAWYLKDELLGEYEKAGSEIKETIDEIIKTVEERKAAELVESK